MLSTIVQVILALPKIFAFIKEFINALRMVFARNEYEKSLEQNREVTKKVDEAQTPEQKQAALDEAAKRWGNR